MSVGEKYDQISDEELIGRIRDGEEIITEYIIQKYKNLVRSKAKAMFILGAHREDLIQEGMIGLFKAIRDYDSGRDASFYTFADLCLTRQMYNAVQASGRQKHIPLNSYVSLYSHVGDTSAEKTSDEMILINVLSPPVEQNPELLLIDKENVKALEETIEKELSKFEKQVLDLYVTGMTYSQIAKVLGKDEKSTDNALNRMKSKLRKVLSEQGMK